MKGLQDEGVYATAKHFPGHDDTSTDSHLHITDSKFRKNRWNDVELFSI